MRRILLCAVLVSAGSLAAAGYDQPAAKKLLAGMPISFERNAGQVTGHSADWVGRANGFRVALDATGATILPANRSDSVRMEFRGARRQALSQPLDPLPGRANYLVGRDPQGWIRNLETYGRVRYQDVYPGVDVVWYGGQGQLEYDFVVRPGADPNRIRVRFRGARQLALEPGGDVRIETAAGAMTLRLPEVYQKAAGARRRIAGRYRLLADDELAFELAAYDRSKPLVIDPTLAYGSNFGTGLTIAGIATDPQGNVYIGGYTRQNAAFPIVNAFQADLPGWQDSFVVKFDPTGTTILYSTYVGGSGADWLSGLTVDASGEVIATGYTDSTDFPLVNPAQSQVSGAFAFKMSAAGNTLVYSTYLGGSATAEGYAAATDAAGNAYITGMVQQGAFTTTPGAYQTAFGGGNADAFVVKLGATGNLVYSTLLGGAGYDKAQAIAADPQGNAYVAGYTSSTSFPGNPPGARTTNAGGDDAFVAKLTADGSAVAWLTLLGGSGDDIAVALTRDSASGTLYVAGFTTSADLPTTAGVIQPSLKGSQDAFAASVAPDGMSFGFVTYLDGSKQATITGIAPDPAGNLALAGETTSPDFPLVNAIQSTFLGSSLSLYKTANLGITWTPINAGVPSQIGAISVDPSNPATILVASVDSFGVYRTTNGGASWTAVSPLLPVQSTGYPVAARFVRTPANPSVVYVCFPGGVATNPGGGTNEFPAMRSTDGGATWQTLGLPVARGDLGGLVVSTTDPNSIVETDGSWIGPASLFRSTDGGATFTGITAPASLLGGGAIAAGPNGSLVVSTYPGLVYVSPDFGTTWISSEGGGGGVLYSSASNPSIIYAYPLAGSGIAAGLSKSTDGGKTWNTVKSPPSQPIDIEVASGNPNVLVAVIAPPAVSTDGASTWSRCATEAPNGAGAFAVDSSGTVYASTPSTSVYDGFVAKLTADGKSLRWSTLYTSSYGSNPVSVATLPSGDVWIAGNTLGSDLPVTHSNSSASGGFLAHFSDPTVTCTYAISPSSTLIYSTAGVASGASFSVTAPSGCAWTAVPSDSSWISVSSGASGTGAGAVSLTLFPNSTGSTRTGAVNVNGQVFAISEADAGCIYGLSANPPSMPAAGGTVQVTVTPSEAGCPWKLTPQSSALTIVSGGSGTGNGVATFSAAPNGSSQPLDLEVTLNHSTLDIPEASACQYSVSPTAISGAAGSGTMTVTPNMAGCQWSASGLSASWISGDGSSHTGAGSFPYTVTANAGPPRSTQFLGATITQAGEALQFVPVPPCRVADTRNAAGPFGGPALDGVSSRTFTIPQSACGIPASAQAYSLNVTAVPHGTLEYLTLWPAGQTMPVVSTLNSWDGEVVANAAIVPAGTGGGVSVFAPNPTDVVLDIGGYFDTPSVSTSALYLVPPCRLVDTRLADGPLAGPALTADSSRDFPLPTASCGLPASATAYSLNVTAVPDPTVNFLAYLTVWPTGETQPFVSTLNSWTGAVVANAAIVPSGSNGSVSVYAHDPTNVILDTNGYFAAAGQAGALSFYPLPPCRVVDTRNGDAVSGSTMDAGETRAFALPSATQCNVPATAAAYSLNVTVVPEGALWYLTAWAGDGAPPNVSTLNSWDGSVVANAAIVPAAPSTGDISVYVTTRTDVILDIDGYFAP